MIPTTEDLERGLDHLRAAPGRVGTLDLLVRRPRNARREVLAAGVLDLDGGLVGDNWLDRATSRAVAEGRHLKAQVTVMSSRMARLLGPDEHEQALAGDQLYVDLDLSAVNLPAGTRLAVGEAAVVEVTDKPHRGCAKFQRYFGDDALAFVNSPVGIELRLRGLNARVVAAGTVRPGDRVTRLDRGA